MSVLFTLAEMLKIVRAKQNVFAKPFFCSTLGCNVNDATFWHTGDMRSGVEPTVIRHITVDRHYVHYLQIFIIIKEKVSF